MNSMTTRRLTLRRVEEADWPALKAVWDSFRASPYARYDKPHPADDDEVRARVARWASYSGSAEHMFFAVCLDSQFIGYIALHAREEGVYECGYRFHSAFHGRGYAGESLRALIGLLREMGAKKLTAGTALNNAPSVRLLKSLGFDLVGTEPVSFYQDADGNDIVFEGGVFALPL